MNNTIRNIFSSITSQTGIYLSKWMEWEENQIQINKLAQKSAYDELTMLSERMTDDIEHYPLFGPRSIGYSLGALTLCGIFAWSHTLNFPIQL